MNNMAKKSGLTGVFPINGVLKCTQSAADTLTVGEAINFGSSLIDNRALLIKNIIYSFSAASMTALNADGDRLLAAIVVSSGLASFDFDDPRTRHICSLELKLATAVGQSLIELHRYYDFSMRPGGGLLLPASRCYLGVYSSGTGIANAVQAKAELEILDLNDSDYQSLLKALDIFTAD